MWAARPRLGSIFEKLLHRKTFGCLRLVLGKPLVYSSARLGHIPSLPGNRNCPWNLVSHYNLSIFEGNCDSSDSLLDFCFISLFGFVICSANVGCSPTPRQHFWKTAAPKNFLAACGSYFAACSFPQTSKSGCSISTGFQKLVEGTSALLFYFFRMLLLTLM